MEIWSTQVKSKSEQNVVGVGWLMAWEKEHEVQEKQLCQTLWGTGSIHQNFWEQRGRVDNL